MVTRTAARAGEMALLQHLQRNNGQPDLKGSLSSTIPPQAIARANQEVQAATEKEVQVREKGKRGAYHQYSPEECTDIGRYVAIYVKAVNTQPFHNPPFSQPNMYKF